jgi:ERCC4-related helicase
MSKKIDEFHNFLEQQHKECQKKYGKFFYYDVPIPKNGDKILKIIDQIKKNKISFGCKEYKFDKKEDQEKNYFPRVKTEKICKELNGFWHPKKLNKVNFFEKGVCYVNENEKKCLEEENQKLIKNRAQKKFILGGEILEAKKNCENVKFCHFDDTTLECRFQKIVWPDNISDFKNFQKFLSDYYYHFLESIPQTTFTNLGEEENKNNCVKVKKIISQPQIIINTIFKHFAKKNNESRGLLVWHNAGSGKTCSAAGMIDAFWETEKNIVVCSSIEGLKANPVENYISCLKQYYQRFQNFEIEKITEMFKKRKIIFFSFARLAHFLQLHRPVKTKDVNKNKNFLNNALLIIDEVHNLFNPLPAQKKEHEKIVEFLLNRNSYTKNLVIGFLTATPGNNISEIVDLLNIIRSPTTKKIQAPDFNNDESIKNFSESIKGLVSYFNMRADLSRFPKIVNLKPHLKEMSMTQYLKYLDAYSKVNENQKNFSYLEKKKLLRNYYIGARKYSNSIWNFEKNISLYEFSCKIPVFLEQLEKFPNEKHYLYSAFNSAAGFGAHGIIAVANILTRYEKYKSVTITDIKKWNQNQSSMKPAKRFVILLKKGSSNKNVKDIMDFFNHEKNKNGEICQLLLTSQNFNEGLDFKDLMNIHIFEPFLTEIQEIQAIGRGVRFCSHSRLPKDKWIVRIHKYLADKPVIKNVEDFKEKHKKNLDKEMIDFQIEKESKSRLIDYFKVLNILKKEAVDCAIFSKFHAQVEIPYSCSEN